MGKKLYAYITILLACCAISPAVAQTGTNMTHWMFARSNFNPAATGANKGMEFMLWDREQWVGLQGRPSTQMLNAYGYIDKIKSGIGGTVMFDRIGVQSNLHLRVNYAYHISVSEKAHISLGVGGGFVYHNTRINDLDFEDPNDPIVNNFEPNKFTPDIAGGIEVVHKRYLFGISMGQLMGSATSSYPAYARSLNVYGNYSINIAKKTRLVPGVLIRTPFYNVTFEGNLMGYFLNDRVWAGFTYRFQDAVAGMAGVQICKTIKLGYSYDHSIGKIRPYNTGTHEIMLIYSLKKERKKKPALNNPRNY